MRRRRVSTSGAMKHSGQHGLDWNVHSVFTGSCTKQSCWFCCKRQGLQLQDNDRPWFSDPVCCNKRWWPRCGRSGLFPPTWWNDTGAAICSMFMTGGRFGVPAWCMGTLLWCMYQAFSCSFHLTCIQASQDLGATRNGGILRNLMRHLKRIWLGARGANSSCYCFEVTWKGMVWCFLRRWPERTQPQWPHGSFATSWNGRPLWSTTLIG